MLAVGKNGRVITRVTGCHGRRTNGHRSIDFRITLYAGANNLLPMRNGNPDKE